MPALAVAAAPIPFVVRAPTDDGVAARTVTDLAVAADGVVWLGTPSGPRRYDGRRIEPLPWNGGTLPIEALATADDGDVIGLTRAGALVRMNERGAQPIPGPPGAGPSWRVAVDPDGAIWTIAAGRAQRRDARGRWDGPLDAHLEAGERPIHLLRRGDRLLVTTDRAVWAVASGRAIRLIRRPRVEPIVEAIIAGDDLYTMTFGGVLERWRGGAPTEVAAPRGRAISLAERGGVVWATWDAWLGRIHGTEAELWRIEHGGRLEVTPDGALLHGGPGGLAVMPEPETRRVELRPGVTGYSVRALRADADRVWLSTWSGAAHLDDGRITAQPADVPALRGAICPDGAGGAWAAARTEVGDHFWLWKPPNPPQIAAASPGDGGCASDPGGGVWLGAGATVWRVPPRGEGGPVKVADAPIDTDLLALDRYGRVWIGAPGAVCRAEPRAGGLGPWSCDHLEAEGPAWPSAALATSRDAAIVTTIDRGLYRIDRGVDRPAAADAALRSHQLEGVYASPRGGAWIAGYDVLARVDPVTFEELERIGAWHGLPAAGGHAVLERADGALWVGGATGLVRVARASREALSRPLRPVLIGAQIGGRTTPPAARIAAPAPPSSLTLEFVAPSYRDPSLVRYRLRRGAEPPVPLPMPTLQLVDLPPGAHRFAVEASLDGRTWSRPAVVTVEVALPWWRTPWALAAFAAALAGGGALVVRWRTSVAVARERERTRLAMDLHDELGSALGSVRLLADVLGRPTLDDATRRTVAGRVQQTAREVHEALQVLVGALRPGAATAGALLDRLEARARATVEPTGGQVLVVAAPEARALPLSVTARGELERIGLEALHNAVRHGRPRAVTIGLVATPAGASLWIADDGDGFDPADARPDGLGLATMRARARRLGGALTLATRPGDGCTVTVTFDPAANPTPGRRS